MDIEYEKAKHRILSPEETKSPQRKSKNYQSHHNDRDNKSRSDRDRRQSSSERNSRSDNRHSDRSNKYHDGRDSKHHRSDNHHGNRRRHSRSRSGSKERSKENYRRDSGNQSSNHRYENNLKHHQKRDYHQSTNDSKKSPEKIVTIDHLLSLDYPFCKYHRTEEHIKSAFTQTQKYTWDLGYSNYKVANMQHLTSEHMKYSGRSVYIKIDPDDYWKMGFLSDYFNETVRVKGRRDNEPLCPIDYWMKHKNEVVKEFEATKKPISIREINEFLYSKVIGCNTFKAYLLTGASKNYHAYQVLDFSSGWGDRLIGALAAGIEYTGVDPNSDLYEGYRNILEAFGSGKVVSDSPLVYKNLCNTYQMICSPFQTADLSTNTFDLVFTSPPYFDVEVYSDADTQSIKQFPTLNIWEEGFLYPSLKKAWSRLRPNGHLVLILGNSRDRTDFTLNAVEWGNKNLAEAEYLGLLPYGKASNYPKVQPMWIWRKKISLTLNELYYIGNEKCEEIQCDSFEELERLFGQKISKKEDSCVYLGEEAKETLDYGTVKITDASVRVKAFKNIILEDLNPKVVIQSQKIDDERNVSIIAENLLISGTTVQRGFDFSSIEANEIVYAGSYSCYSQVAVALCSKLYKKQATLFLSKNDFQPTLKALQYECRVVLNSSNELDSGLGMEKLNSAAANHAKEKNAYLIPKGLNCPNYKNQLTANLKTALADVLDCENVTGTIWIVVGYSTVLLSVLYQLFPKAKFAVVEVGLIIPSDQIDKSRTTVHKAEEDYYESAHVLPPYWSAIRFDAKAWQLIKKHAKDGDLVWNGAES